MFQTILVHPIFNLLAFIYAVVPGHDFGVAVILLTLIVRAILWPLVNRQLHSQRALQRLQPEVARVRTQAAGDKQKESKLLMELYREKGINPFSSLLPLLIQLPIFIALYAVLRDIIKPGEIAHVTYASVMQLSAIHDIIIHGGSFHPTFLGFVNLAKPAWYLALIAGLCQFVQTKMLSPKATKGDAQAQAVAGMTYIFPVVTFAIGLSLPSALALYWTVTSLVAILQQYLVLRRDVQELEAEAPVTTNLNPTLPTATKKRNKKKAAS